MSNNIYNILGKLKDLTNTATPTPEAQPTTVYESVEARGSITEAVTALEAKYKLFNESQIDEYSDAEHTQAMADFKARGGKVQQVKPGSAKNPISTASRHISGVGDAGRGKSTGHAAKSTPKGKPVVTAESEGYFAISDEEAQAQRDATKARAQGAKRGLSDATARGLIDGSIDMHTAIGYGTGVSPQEAQYLQDMYDDVSREYYLHADDDFEQIYQHMYDWIEDEYDVVAESNDTDDNVDYEEFYKNQPVDSEVTDLDNYKFADADKDASIAPASAKQSAADKRKRLQDLADRKAEKDDWFSGKDKTSNVRTHRASHQDFGDIDETAPPGAKAERMVKHIKKGYAKDGNLTKREKGIAYATAWKAHNKGQVEEGVEFKDTIKNSAPDMKKAKATKLKESRVMEDTDYFYEQIAKALADKNSQLNTADGEFYDAVLKEMIAQGMKPNRARNVLLMDEDFLSDVATSYGHYCKVYDDEVGDDLLHGARELDEIAALAGLAPRADNEVDMDIDNPDEYNRDFSGDDLDDDFIDESEVEEGNEFSGALAAAKASGAKEFEVAGTRYTVKEDININITANGEEDALNLIRKLSGMSTAEPIATLELPQDAETAIAQGVIEPVEVDEERDIEYSNTPNEKISGIDAAIPSGTDLHRAKKSYSDKPYRGDNPMAVAESKDDGLWKKYSSLIKNLKA